MGTLIFLIFNLPALLSLVACVLRMIEILSSNIEVKTICNSLFKKFLIAAGVSLACIVILIVFWR